jgi:hypothetical protein
MPVLNRNVGIGGLDAGLCLIVEGDGPSMPEIDTNEFGLAETTLRFATFAANLPEMTPARGTPCPDFIGGNSRTNAVLAALDYLGAQSSKRIPNGQGDGVDILEVLCQGANFNTTQGATSQRIASIDIATKGLVYTSPPILTLSGGGVISPAQIVTRLEFANQRQVNAGGTAYQVGDVLTVVGGQFVRPVRFIVDAIGVGGSVRFADGGIIHSIDNGAYSLIPANSVSVTGGHGTGATIDLLAWRLGYVVVLDGGAYTGTPVASLSGGGTPNPAATLGDVNMAQGGVGAGSDITTPFNPISSTKDTVQFVSYQAAGSSDLQARLVATVDLGAVTYYTHTDGTIRLASSISTTFPDVDGVRASVGDLILLIAETNPAYNGLYKLVNRGGTGQNGSPWILTRVNSMDQADEFTTTVYVQVSDGANNSNTRWHCTTAVITLGVDPITFVLDITVAQPTPTLQITIEYEAIDLHFEYASKTKLQRSRFVQNEYSLDAEGLLIIDPVSGDKMLLAIDSAIGQAAIVDATSGAVTFSAVGQPLNRSAWQSLVRYIGTASRLEQTPAGQFWHILETATIKIEPIG